MQVFNHQNNYFTKLGKCLRGEPIFREVAPDRDLGTSIKYRNLTGPGDEGRFFGIPTIRRDIRRPRHKSIADQNVK